MCSFEECGVKCQHPTVHIHVDASYLTFYYVDVIEREVQLDTLAEDAMVEEHKTEGALCL